MTIAEVSKKYDLTQDTIRYYERIGLLPEIPRTKSGIRDFDEKSCKWVEFIKCMRSAGMPIEALIEYMTLFKQGKETVTARKQLLIEQREVLLDKQEEIKKTIERLDYKIELYNEIEAGKRKDFMEQP
ncbi:MAG: MerR family transcriptional regulator [Anaeroplasma sp.]